MLPDGVLSTEPVEGQFLYPRNIPRTPLIDYEMGGTDIEDPSEGLQVKAWRGQVLDDSVVLDAPGVVPVAVITVPHITEFSFTFDQSMRPFVTYVLEDFSAHYYWYDTTISAYTTSALPFNSFTPRCSLDDKRALQSQSSDIILAYFNEQSLYFRVQRERFLIDHVLAAEIGGALLQVGMNNKNRFQFSLRP